MLILNFTLGIYLVNILIKACSELLFMGCRVPYIQNIWLFTSIPIEIMINDKKDGHHPYNIYQVNLDRNLLIPLCT